MSTSLIVYLNLYCFWLVNFKMNSILIGHMKLNSSLIGLFKLTLLLIGHYKINTFLIGPFKLTLLLIGHFKMNSILIGHMKLTSNLIGLFKLTLLLIGHFEINTFLIGPFQLTLSLHWPVLAPPLPAESVPLAVLFSHHAVLGSRSQIFYSSFHWWKNFLKPFLEPERLNQCYQHKMGSRKGKEMFYLAMHST